MRKDAPGLLWVSDPGARHSCNISLRPEIGVVIFDSIVPIGAAEGVYIEAFAQQLGGTELERAIEAYSASIRAAPFSRA
jgi:hypothetical protein